MVIQWGYQIINGWQTYITLPIECSVYSVVCITHDDNDAYIALCAVTKVSNTQIRPLTAYNGQWHNNCPLSWILIGKN